MAHRRASLIWLVVLGACQGTSPLAVPPPLSAPPAPTIEFAPGAAPEHEPPRVDPPPLAVLDHGPRGATDLHPDIHVRFNQAVVSLGEGALREGGIKLEIRPNTAGRCLWRTPDLLVFEPKEMPPARRFTAEIRVAEDASAAVRALFSAKPLSWAFETPGPMVEDWLAGDENAWGPRDKIYLKLSQPVELARLRERLRVRTPAGPVAVRIERVSSARLRDIRRAAESSGNTYGMFDPRSTLAFSLLFSGDDLPGRLFQVSPVTRWPVAAEITIEVMAGLVGLLGPVPSSGDWRQSFKTPGPLTIKSLKRPEHWQWDNDPTVILELSADVAHAQLRHISVIPAPPDLHISSLGEHSGTDVEIFGRFAPDKTYTLRLSPRMRDVNGNTVGDGTRGRPLLRSLPEYHGRTMKLSSGGTFAATTSPLIGLETRRVKSVLLRAAMLDVEAEMGWLAESRADRKIHDLLESIAGATPARILTKRYDLSPAGPTQWSDIPIDLRDLVGPRRGRLLVEVEAIAGAGSDENLPDPVSAQFLITDLAPIVFHSTTRTLVKVARLSDGQPVSGAKLVRHHTEPSRWAPLGQTDEHGLLVIERADDEHSLDGALLLVMDDARQDYAPIGTGGVGQSGRGKKVPGEVLRPAERLLTGIVTERHAYRPQDTVHVVGWTMVDSPFVREGLRALEKETPVELKLRDHDRKVVAEKTVLLDADGKWWAKLPIPRQTPLGFLELTADVLGHTNTSHLKLEDFRTPEYAVTARPSKPWIVTGETAQVRVAAAHYSGIPVTIDRVDYRATCHAIHHPLPSLENGWTVGPWTQRKRAAEVRSKSAQEAAGQRGSATFAVDFSADQGAPNRCTAEVQVQDAARQAVGSEAQFLVHPASFYLALRSPRGSRAGERGAVLVRALAPDATRMSARGVKVEAERSWTREIRGDDGSHARWEMRKEKVASCRLDVSASEEATCALGVLREGTYTITATGQDAKARAVRTQDTFWVPRPVGGTSRSSKRAAGVQLVMNVERIAGKAADDAEPGQGRIVAGDRLRVSLVSPCESRDVLLLLERAGIREQHLVKLVGHEGQMEFVSDDSWTPRVELQAVVVCPGSNGGHASIHTATQTLEQPAKQRSLTVTVSAPAQARPGATIPLTVAVRDAKGEKPVAAHVALWAVDEAVLSLTGYQAPDPLSWFVPDRHAETRTTHGFDGLLRPHEPSKEDPSLQRGGLGYGVGGLGMGSGGLPLGGSSSMSPPPPARARFETTPVFLGDLQAGPDGTARISARLPDNLTTFRITAIASARLESGGSPGRFGIAESHVQVTAPLVVRAALPRILRPGDTAEIAAIVENQSEHDGQVVVEASIVGSPDARAAAPSLGLAAPARTEAALPASGQVRVPFHVQAGRPGTPEVELRARFVPHTDGPGQATPSDAIRLPLPVEAEPTLVDRAATYGSLTSDQATAVRTHFPPGLLAGVGGISVSMSDSLLGDLQDALDYLVDYPYGCIEQTASRVLSLLAARQIGARYALPSDKVAKYLADGIARMASMQTRSGGFAYWPEVEGVHPYATAFATWTLLLAKGAGVSMPDQLVERALDFLEKSLVKDGKTPASPLAAGADIVGAAERAIALHALADSGRALPAEALDVAYAQRGQLPHFARALLLMALARTAGADDARAQTMQDELLGAVSELPATAHMREIRAWGLDQVFHSDTRTDAMTLLALLQVAPKHAVVAKLVRGLLERRSGGRWRNTQENAYAIWAVLEYARRFEATNAQFVAEAWVNEKPILTAPFGARPLTGSSTKWSSTLPMADVLALGKPATVVLRRQGQGRAYFRVGTEWAPSGDALESLDKGIDVKRAVRASRAQRANQEVASVAAGDPVAFDLTIANRTQVGYVAVNVPVPAGLEPVLENLGKGHAASNMGGSTGYWITHQEKRPDRVLLFADSLQPGVHHHTIQLRATTPGNYTLPPARAESMYTPEVYGRSNSSRLTVK